MKSLKKSNFRRGKIKNSKRKKLIGGYNNGITYLLLDTHNSLEDMVNMYYYPLGLNTLTKEVTEVSTGFFQPQALYGEQAGNYGQQHGNYGQQQGNYGDEEEPQGFLGKIVKKTKEVAKEVTGKFGITIDKKQPKQEVKKKSSVKAKSNKPEEKYSGINWPEDNSGIYI